MNTLTQAEEIEVQQVYENMGMSEQFKQELATLRAFRDELNLKVEAEDLDPYSVEIEHDVKLERLADLEEWESWTLKN